MDISEFHQIMQDKYAKKEDRHSLSLRFLRIWLLCSATLLVLVLSLALAYFRHGGK